MEIGVVNGLRPDRPGGVFARVQQFGLKTCQLTSWNPALWTEEVAAQVVADARAGGVRPCAFWSGYSGPARWNFTEGPVTLGLVPPEYRAQRVADLKRGADFAARIGVPAIITHCGFIPENMTDPNYREVVDAIAEVAGHCASLGIEFWFETGQETPVVLLRVIEDAGTGNFGINLDPANLLMYGKGNPLDALEVFGTYVRNLHVKDGLCPTNGRELGREVQVGTGRVGFPRLLARLKSLGFDGELIIEREIREGEEQNRDIRQTIANLETWWRGEG
ncbi:MAG: sugar phosphate isomerase/epimerase [Lentisphaeria bacterium]|nr:sugar phosphate isomerase/epimerase [Lentisphaeria bacterium]